MAECTFEGMSKAPYVSFAVRPREGRRLGAAEVVESVLREVRAGHLPAGSRLPPVRALEHTLGLSKNTVQSAYDELCARGVLEAREREGVFVALTPEARPAAATPYAPPLLGLREGPALSPARIPRDATNLSTVFLDPDLLPGERVAECVRSVLRTPGLGAFYDAQGYPPLREAIAARLRARGMDVEADHVVLTTGSQQAIDLVARACAVPRVALESPVYSHARLLFHSLGASVLGLPLDPFAGVDLGAWESLLAAHKPGLLYAITSFQNPTGYSYSTHELEGLLSLAERLGFALVEDDWGSEMLSQGEYRPTLRALGGRSVVYLNSFTKKLWPSLRVGFLVADPSLVPTLVGFKRLATLGNAWLSEATIAEFLDRGYYDAHLTSLQRELDARYAACLEALESSMPEGVRWTRPGGGPTLWLEVPRSVDLEALRARMSERRVNLEDTSSHFTGAPQLHGFRVSYAFSKPEPLRAALAALGEELARCLRGEARS